MDRRYVNAISEHRRGEEAADEVADQMIAQADPGAYFATLKKDELVLVDAKSVGDGCVTADATMPLWLARVNEGGTLAAAASLLPLRIATAAALMPGKLDRGR